MTITKAVWYKKTCRTIIYSTASFLIFPLSEQGCAGELMLSSSSPHCQGSFSHKYLAAAVLSQHERQGAGWSRVRGWSAEWGSCQSGKKEGKHLFRGQMRRARSAAETQPFAAAMQVHPKSARHRESHNLHARAGLEGPGQLE